MRRVSVNAMDGDALRAWCLRMPGAVETFPFNPGTSVFKAREGGRMFALSRLDGDPLKVSVKGDPEIVVSMQRSYEAAGPGYHLNKRHWMTITIGGDLPDERIRDLVEDSYDLVKPKR